MPKQIKELRGFMTGTISSPSASDVPDEAAIHSKNLETINEEGKLKGCKEEVGKKSSEEILTSYIYQSDESLPSVGDKFEFYISNKLIHTATIVSADIATEFAYKAFLETALEAIKTAYPSLEGYEVLSRTLNNSTVPVETLGTDLDISDPEGNSIVIADTVVKFLDKSGTPSVEIDATNDDRLFLGQRFKIDDEIMTIEGWEDESIGLAIIERGSETGESSGVEETFGDGESPTSTTPADHAAETDIYLQADFYAFTLLWGAQVDSPSFSIVCTNSSGGTAKTFLDDNFTEYMEIHGRNMVLKNKKMDDQVRTVSNVIYYDVDRTATDGTPPAYEMRVLEDFYGELGSPEIKVPSTPNVPGEPESVSLVGASTATYIGTGNTSNSIPLWLGEIFEKRFGNKVEGYHLEEAELKALDDGQAVFNLDHMDAPHTVTAGSTPAPSINTSHFVCSSKGRYNLILHKNTDSDEASTWGKQYKSSLIGGDPSAICSSKTVCKVMADTGNSSAGDFEPYWESTWGGTQDANAENLDGHGDGDTSYHWVAYKDEPNSLSLIAVRFFTDENTKNKVLINILRTWVLTHKIKIDSTLAAFTNWADGSEINRPPKPGSYISDILEKEDGTVYVQYSHAGGFTFDHEWLYTFNPVVDGTGYGMTAGTGTAINMKPITPPAIKIKNWGRDVNSAGHDWYMPEDVFDGGGLGAGSWIGQCGLRGCYANYFKWRSCDFLGYTPGSSGDPKHVYEDGKAHGHWHMAKAASITFLSGSESNKFPSYNAGLNDDGYPVQNWTDNYSWFDNNGGYSGANFGKSFGFTDYIVRPAEKGLTNFSKSSEEVGVVVHLEGKQLTTEVSLGKHTRKWSPGLFTHKKRFSTFNKTAPVLKDWNEVVVMTASKHSYGTRQRCIAPDSKFFYSYTYEYEYQSGNPAQTYTGVKRTGSLSTSYISKMNGTTGAAGANQIPNGLPGNAGHGTPIKNTFRSGSFFNLNDSSAGSDDYMPTTVFKRSCNRHLYQLLPSSTEQSGQDNNNTSVYSPNNIGELSGVSKNLENQDFLWMTARKPEEDVTNTYLQRWNKDIHTNSNEPVDYDSSNGFTVSSIDHNPIEIQDIGSCILTQNIVNTDHHRITLSPRVGTYRSGYVEYDPALATPYFTTPTGTQIDSENEYFHKYPNSALDFGMDITYINTEADADAANFKSGKTYWWKISMLYDGFQESPLTTWEFSKAAGGNFNKARLTVKIADPPKRVTHIVIYRKNAVEQFYRMVKEVSLADGWIFNASKDEYKTYAIDEGKQGASYQAITGMPESLRDTSINYKLSTVALGSLIVADCHHPQIKQGQNFIFKSESNQFSNFNWSRSYTVLPNRPTHIIWWAGRVYAFDLSNIYKIEAMNLVLEDTYEGIGCIGPDSCTVTDIGMFFADYQGMYWHNGQRAENISRDIVHSSYGGDLAQLVESDNTVDEEWNSHNWQHINHQRDPQVLYDGKTQSVYFCFEDKHEDGTLFSGAWVYSTTRKRWDLREMPTPVGKLTGNKNDIYVSSETALHQIAASNNSQKDWTFHSKTFDMGVSSINKVFSSFKMVFNTNAEAVDFEDGGIGVAKFFVDETEITSYNKEVEDNALTFKFTTTDKKGKKFRFELNDMKVEIDSVAMIYRIGSVK